METLPFLGLTIAIEFVIIVLFFRWKWKDAAIFSILINLITWPIGMYLYHHWQINWYILESGITVVEAIAVYHFWNVNATKAIFVALVANAVTAFFLPILHFIGIDYLF